MPTRTCVVTQIPSYDPQRRIRVTVIASATLTARFCGPAAAASSTKKILYHMLTAAGTPRIAMLFARPVVHRMPLARMVHTEKRIEELGFAPLPPPAKPLATYVPWVRTGNLIMISGHIPFQENMKDLHVGKVGKDFTTEEGAQFAQRIGLLLTSTLKSAVGDLDKVKKIVKLVGFVNCPDDYTEQPEVLNGCSHLMAEIFGPERGPHARSAVGTNVLPRNVPVEIEMIAEVED